jgi:hypothetical protein
MPNFSAPKFLLVGIRWFGVGYQNFFFSLQIFKISRYVGNKTNDFSFSLRQNFQNFPLRGLQNELLFASNFQKFPLRGL